MFLFIYLKRAITATFSTGPCCPLFYGCSKKHDLTYKENRNLEREQLFDKIVLKLLQLESTQKLHP